MSSQSVRRFKHGSNAIVGTILLIVSLVAVYYIADRSSWRIDLTRNQRFTLASATQNILKRLDSQVNVTVYATSEGTPPAWTEQRNQLRDLLMEYRSLSKGKVKFTFVDPSKDPAVERKAQENQIRRQLMAQESAKEMSARDGYLGFVVEHSGKTETVGVISPQHPLEYQLTMAINKVAQVSIPKIGIITPEVNQYVGEQGRYQAIPQVLQQEGYDIQSIAGSNYKQLLAADAPDMTFLLEPSKLSDEQLFQLDQYVMKGGKLFIASSSFNPAQPGMGNQPNGLQPFASPVNSILDEYGLRINEDLVEDWGLGVEMMLRTTRGPVITKYPLTFRITDLNKETSATDRLGNIAFQYASSISQTDKAVTGTITMLAKSSEKSLRQENLFRIDPTQLLQRPKDENNMKAYNLLAMANGVLHSKYADVKDEDLPILTKDDGTTYIVERANVLSQSKEGAAVIVSGSCDAFGDELIQQSPLNALLVLNLVDTNVRHGEMISLRSKMSEVPRLRIDIPASRKDLLQWLVIGGVPVCLIVLGIGVAVYNRMRRRRLGAIYGSSMED